MSHARLLFPAPRAVLALLFASGLAACSEDELPTAPRGLPPLRTQFAVAASDSQARTGRDAEAVVTQMALAMPGFGGFAFDTANGDLIIRVKDVNLGPAAAAMVQGYLAANYRGRGGRAGARPPVRIEPAAYDFLELGSIRDRVNAALEGEPAHRSTGISESRNRVEVGGAPGTAATILARLDAAGIPRSGYRLSEEPIYDESWDPNDPTTFPPEIDPASVDTTQGSGAPIYLDSKLAAVGGGAMITFLGTGDPPLYYLKEYACTVGAIVKNANGQTRMLTAAHCSISIGQNDGVSYYQPHINNYDKTKPVTELPFAVESLDPGWKSALPSWIAYKWADALLADAPVSPRVVDFGYIHRPVTKRTDWYNPGSSPHFQIDPTKPRFRIVATDVPNLEGEVVSKVGRSTGWTEGQVTVKCYDWSFGSSQPKRTFRCGVRTSIPSWFGDSGAPVFRILAGDDTYVELIGILSTKNSTTQATNASRWDGIQAELGTLNAVAP